MSEPVIVTVPLFDATREAPDAARARALKRHIVDALRDLRSAKWPERLARPSRPEPAGFAAEVVAAACATCAGHCCKGGGDHAYLDASTMARVRRDNPDLDAGAIVRLYLRRIAPAADRTSCLFHGASGCMLERSLRADLCNAYHCNGLRDFLRITPTPERVRIHATRQGATRVGATRDQATRDGATRQGATRVGATRVGATRDGATRGGPTRDGAAGNGAAHDGLTGDGATHDGRERWSGELSAPSPADDTAPGSIR